jgi:hypothetical protein
MGARPADPRPASWLKYAGYGALIGTAIAVTAAFALAYLPDLIQGNDFYENTDPLFVYTVVLVPICAAAGLLAGTMVSAVRSPSPLRMAVALALLVLALLGGAQIWSELTGAPGLF